MNATASIKRLAYHDILSAERTEALVARATAGDLRAERVLVQHNLRLVCGAVNSMAHRPETFEDLFQDGLIAFREAIKTYRPECAERFTGYAYTVIRRRLINSLKAKRNTPLGPATLGGYWEELLHIPEENATEEAVKACEAGEVASHLATLSEREGRIVRSYYGIGTDRKPMTALAREDNVSHERIRQIYWRAIGKLRRSMSVGEAA